MSNDNSLESLVLELRADRLKEKEKAQRESWTRHTSLSLVLIAVLAAVATQWAGKYSTRTLTRLNEATYFQSKASDKWAYYQAKSIKQNLYALAQDQAPAEKSAALAEKAKNYDQEKQAVKAEAEKLEAQRDAARTAADASAKQGSAMGLSVSIFQLAIAVGSLCLLVKKKPLWYASLVGTAIATVQMIVAFRG